VKRENRSLLANGLAGEGNTPFLEGGAQTETNLSCGGAGAILGTLKWGVKRLRGKYTSGKIVDPPTTELGSRGRGRAGGAGACPPVLIASRSEPMFSNMCTRVKDNVACELQP
jgi:hypothetical protein